MPPLLEYLESLLTGTGHDLDLRTFKLVDQLSGRMLGLRADITPQVARIDAHLLNRKGVTRLCYCGSVLHALPGEPGRDARAAPDRRGDLRPRRRRERPGDPGAALPRAGGRRRARCVPGYRARRGVPLHRAARPGSGAELEAGAVRGAPDEGRAGAERARARPGRENAGGAALLPELYGGDEVLAVADKRLPEIPELTARPGDAARAREGLPGSGELRPRGAARLSLPHRRGVRRLLQGRCRRDRARRTLRRGRQGVRAAAAGHRLLDRPAQPRRQRAERRGRASRAARAAGR